VSLYRKYSRTLTFENGVQSQAAREEAVRTFANVTEAAAGAEAQMKELETRVEEEEAFKSRLATRLKEVESGNLLLAETLKAMMQEKMECLEKLEQANKERKALEERVAAMTEGEGAAMQALSAQLAAAEEERVRAMEEVQQLKALLREADEEKSRVAGEATRLSGVEGELGQMRSEVETLRTALQEAEEAKGELEEEKARLDGEVKRLGEQAVATEVHKARRQEEQMRLQSENENLSARLRAAQERIEELVLELEQTSAASAEAATAGADVAAAEAAEVAQLRIAKAEEEVASVRAELEALQAQGLEERIKDMETQLAAARDASAMAEAQVEGLTDLKSKLGANLKAKMHEQMECLEKLEQADTERKALEDKVAKLTEGEGAAMQELSAQLAAAEEERGRATVEVEQLKAMLQDADAEKALLLEETSRLEEEIVRLGMLAQANASAVDVAQRDGLGIGLRQGQAAAGRAEEELQSAREADAALSQPLADLMTMLGLPPLGARVERIKAVTTKVRELQDSAKMLAQKVQLLEALKAQHEEHQALLQTQLADAMSQKESIESIAAAAAASSDGTSAKGAQVSEAVFPQKFST
jgi:chromosome segregation ATPase